MILWSRDKLKNIYHDVRETYGQWIYQGAHFIEEAKVANVKVVTDFLF